MALPATKVSAPAAAIAPLLSVFTPPSISRRISRPGLLATYASISARVGELVARARAEALAAEAGVARPQPHPVDLVHHGFEEVERLCRLGHQAGEQTRGGE